MEEMNIIANECQVMRHFLHGSMVALMRLMEQVSVVERRITKKGSDKGVWTKVVPDCVADKRPSDDLGVFEKDGKVLVSSRTVAEAFEKDHKHVLRDIETLDCSEDFRQSNFGLSSQTVDMPKGGTRDQKIYLLTRDGFTFLCMGYTGKRAAEFKEAYIKKFNEMEERLRGKTPAQPALPEPAKKKPGKGFWTPEEAAEELGIKGYRALYARLEGMGLVVKNKRGYEPAPDKRKYIGYRSFGTKTGYKYYRPVVLAAGMDYLKRELSV